MARQDRLRRYRASGGAADLVRVEVLLPPSKRAEILETAARIRKEHRERVQHLEVLCSDALAAYATRILDNIDLDRIHDRKGKATLIARALMDRGDAKAFVTGRRILAAVEAL